MSLSQKDQKRVVRALNYPAKVLTEGSLYFNTWVRDQLTGYDSFEAKEIVKLVDKIESQKDSINSTLSKDNVKQIDNIVFDTSKSRDNKLRELSRLQKELCLYTGLTMYGSNDHMVDVCL